MDYKLHKLANGLPVIVVPLPSFESATVTIWVGTGSRSESASINGISHFLEHMAFKGSKKYPSAKIVAEAIDSLGAENNAATDKEWTNYYIKSSTKVINKNFEILSDMVLNPLLPDGEIEREKGVILQEIALSQDTPMKYIFDLIDNLLYKTSPLGWDVLGTSKTVSSLKKPDFLRYREEYYYPQNMLLTVAGGVSDKLALDMAEKYFGSVKIKKSKRQRPNEKFNQKAPRVIVFNKATDQTHLVLAWRTASYGHKDRYVESVLMAILGVGMSSRLFTEVRERRGLAYAIRTNSVHYQDNGYLETYAGVKTAKVDEAIGVIVGEHAKIAQNGLEVTEAELAKAKAFLKGHIALSLEDTESISGFFGMEYLMTRKVRTPEQVYAGIDKVTLNDIQRIAKAFFKPERLNLAIIGPHKDSARFEKLLK